MASSKKKQDEKHLKILREMVALAHNKQCFDCHQRGPTYINMTIGSYVCTACSGLLRGLNPPHRVKSISMASFTPEEMDFIKSRGNEFCRKVWLGLYDNRLGNQSESREESKVKDFMTQKYERKRYYVAPTEAMIEEAKRMNESVISKTPGTRPLKSLLGENAPKIQLGNHHQASSKDVQQNFFEMDDQTHNASSTNPQTANDLFGQSDGLSQPSSNDLFSQSNNPTQQIGDSLFNQPNLDTSAQQSGDNLFGQQGGTNQQSSNDLFALGGNETALSQPRATNPSFGNDLFSGAQSQPGLDLFASSTSSNQSVSNSLFASPNTAAPAPDVGMFGSSTDSQLQQDNPFTAGSSSVQQPGASLFPPSSSSVSQPPAMFDGAPMASLSLTTTSSGDASSLFGFGGQPQGQGQTSSMFTLNTGVSLTTGSASDIQAQNPFNTGGQGHDLFQGQGIQSSGGQQITGSSSSQPNLFSGISSQGQGQSNSSNQGITMETNPFGVAALPSSVEPTPNSAASPFGAQSSQVQMNNSINEPKPVSATPPPVISTPQSPGNTSVQSSKSSGSTAMDLLGDLGGDPFASSTPQTQTTGGFADFGNFGNTGSQSNSGFPTPTQSAGFPPATQQTSQPTPFPQSTPLQPLGSTSSSSNSQTMNGSVAPPAPAAGGDKYSNLSDLFSMATTTESEPATSTGWGLSSTNTSGGINWSSGGTAPSAGGINWGGDSSSTSNVGGVNWNSSSSSQSSASNTNMGWGGASTSNVASTGMSTMSWGGAPATAQSNGLGTPGNPFLQQNSASNPFGVSSGTSLSTQSSMGTAGASNPFGGQVSGAQQGGIGGQPGAQQGGFGGQPGVQQGGFGGQPGVQQGGFGGQPGAQQGGFGGQVPGAQQGGFGGQVPGAQQGGFGAFGSQAGGFGQFGAQQNTAGVNSTPGQFGQFSGMQNGTGYGAMPSAGGFGNASTSTQAGFRQPGQQQFATQPGFGQQQAQGAGGFGAMPASGFGAQSAGFGQPGFGGQPQQQQQMAQGFGGWGQQAPIASTANPFMSTVQQYSAAPKSGATNPFL